MTDADERREMGRRRVAIGSVLRLLRGQLQEPAPEELLWFAVIEHAVRDAYATSAEAEVRREEARQWIDSEFFEGVAAAIGLHPVWARQKIQQLGALVEEETREAV